MSRCAATERRQAAGSPRQGPARLLVAWLPAFRLERCGWRAEEGVALVAPAHGVLRVVAASPAAAREGVRAGMGAAEARALLPDLALEHLDDPAEERRDLQALARLLEGLAPRVEAHPPDVLACRLRPGEDEEAACARVAALLAEVGHLHRLVVLDADRHGAARAGRALARGLLQGAHGRASRRAAARGPEGARVPWRCVPAGGLAEALAEIPLERLGASPGLLEGLAALGITTAGRLARQPAAGIAARFGAEGLDLLRIARAEPAALLPATPAEPPAGGLAAQVELPSPAHDLAALAPALDRAAREVAARLAEAGLAADLLRLRLLLQDLPPLGLPVRPGRPARSADHLRRLLDARLEGLRVGAPVEAVELEVLHAAPDRGGQLHLLGGAAPHESLDELVARLADVLGAAAVLGVRPADSHRPEHAWVPAPPAAGEAPACPGGWSEDAPPRPALLLASPRPVRLQLAAPSRPAAVEVEGRRLGVQEAAPVERLAGGWWEPHPYDREIHALLLADGRRAWVFLDRATGRAWLHGWWD